MSKNKTTFIVLSHEGEHQYDIIDQEVKSGRKISLRYSNNECWGSDVRGKLRLSIINTGDGIEVNRNLKKMDYGDILELRLLLNYEHQTDKYELNRFKYQLVEATNKIEI